MKFIRTSRTVKIAIGAAVVLLGAYFLPQYRPGTPESQLPGATTSSRNTQTLQSARQAAHAQLALITEPDDGVGVVRAAIASATKSVDLVIYELEDLAIEQDLAAAEARGVAVRVILQNVKNFSKHPNQAAFDFLKAHKVPVTWAANYFALTHQKTLIVDANTTNTAYALIMTFNLAPQYYASSRDFGLVDSDPQDIAAIETAFNADWNGTQTPATNGRDLVWSPGSAATLLALIDSASSTLDIYNEEMADPRITAALKAAAARGVRVRVDMSYATNWKAAFNELTAHGVTVRTYASSAKFYIHAKVIIADAAGAAGTSTTLAFVGSENFSKPSLDANRELGILIARADILTSLEKTFNKDWAAARPYVAR